MPGDRPRNAGRLPTVFCGYGSFGTDVLLQVSEAIATHDAPALQIYGGAYRFAGHAGLDQEQPHQGDDDQLARGGSYRFVVSEREPVDEWALNTAVELLELDLSKDEGEIPGKVAERVSALGRDVLSPVAVDQDGAQRWESHFCLWHIASLKDKDWAGRLAAILIRTQQLCKSRLQPPTLTHCAILDASSANAEEEALVAEHLRGLVKAVAEANLADVPILYVITNLMDGAALPTDPRAPTDLSVAFLEALYLSHAFGDSTFQDAARNLVLQPAIPDCRIEEHPMLAAFGVRVLEIPTSRLRQQAAYSSVADLADQLTAPYTEEVEVGAQLQDTPADDSLPPGCEPRWAHFELSLWDWRPEIVHEMRSVVRSWRREAVRMTGLLRGGKLAEIWEQARANEIGQAVAVRERAFGDQGSCALLVQEAPNALSAMAAYLATFRKQFAGEQSHGLQVTEWLGLPKFDVKGVMEEALEEAEEKFRRIPPPAPLILYTVSLLLIVLLAALPVAGHLIGWGRAFIGAGILLVLTGLGLFLWERHNEMRFRRLLEELEEARDRAYTKKLRKHLATLRNQATHHWRSRLAAIITDQVEIYERNVTAHLHLVREYARRIREDQAAVLSGRPIREPEYAAEPKNAGAPEDGREVRLGRRRVRIPFPHNSVARHIQIDPVELTKQANKHKLKPAEIQGLLEELKPNLWRRWLFDTNHPGVWHGVQNAILGLLREKRSDRELLSELPNVQENIADALRQQGEPRVAARHRIEVTLHPESQPVQSFCWLAVQDQPGIGTAEDIRSCDGTSDQLLLVGTDHPGAGYMWTVKQRLTLDSLQLPGLSDEKDDKDGMAPDLTDRAAPGSRIRSGRPPARRTN